MKKGMEPTLQEIRGGEAELVTLRNLFSTEIFKIKDNILVFTKHRNRFKEGDADRVCLPKEMVEEGFKICHEHTLSGHRGIQGTLNKFSSSFFIVSAPDKIRDLVASCDVCLAKIKSLPGHKGIHVPSIVGSVGEKTFIDIVTMGTTPRGNRYILTVQDGFSRYAAAYPVPDKTAATIAKVMVQEHIPIHGVPQQLHSDNGLEFANGIWREMARELGILHTFTPSYNPSSNQVEHFHRTLSGIFRTMGSTVQSDWDLWTKTVCFVHNTTVNASTGQTPFYAYHGREANLPITLIYPTPTEENMTMESWVSWLKSRFQEAYKGMREQQNQAVRRNTRLYKSGKGGGFEVGDKVWYFQPKLIPSLCNKIRNFWQGPFKILKLVSPMLAEISPIYERGGVRTVNIDILHPYHDEETAYSYGYESDVPPRDTRGGGAR